jgi:hypothetical protein
MDYFLEKRFVARIHLDQKWRFGTSGWPLLTSATRIYGVDCKRNSL